MKPNWLNPTPHRKTSDKKVKKVVKKYGGRVIANSGATIWSKGDILIDDCLVEHKCTKKTSYKLNKVDLERHYTDATKIGKTPLFMIEFNGLKFIGEIRRS